MRALIVDDERLARARLHKLLEAHRELTIVGEADSVAAAAAAIELHRPQLIFLDVAMPGGSGFDLLERARPAAHVVFVTAYDEHAVRAFAVGAVDYLVKPIEPARLAETVQRLWSRPLPSADRVCVQSGASLRLVAIADILLVRADGDRTELLLKGGARLPHRDALSRWEARLGNGFARVHRGALVRLAEVERVERAEGSTYRLFLRGSADPVGVSRSHAAALKAFLRTR